MEYLRDFNLVTVTVRLLLAFICGGVIGMGSRTEGAAPQGCARISSSVWARR